jgi:TrpR-related protein YerC/YecD
MKPKRNDSASYKKRTEDALFRVIASLTDVHECRNFMKDLSTPAELQAMVDRWQVAQLLHQDLSYRRINQLTGVSVATIGRVARSVTDGFGGYAAVLSHSAASEHGGDARKPR